MLYPQFVADLLPELKQVTEGVCEYAVKVKEDQSHD